MTSQANDGSPKSGIAPNLNRLPRATYRIQLSGSSGLDHVRALVPYLARLGISDIYLSPLFRAREESAHGYDVVDHGAIDPAFGDLDALTSLAREVQSHAMGILLDVVPNHMGINDPANRWWQDVLENGPASRCADYFDIDWCPPAAAQRGKVLLPVLGRPFGEALEEGEVRLVYEHSRLQIVHAERRFPIAPRTWSPLLRRGLEKLGPSAEPEDREELESIVAQLDHLPPPTDKSDVATRDRYREQRVARRRLKELQDRSTAVAEALRGAIDDYNGRRGEPHSFNLLEELLDGQSYRLAFWRVATDEINYRRFFDINDLAAIRVENPEVFEAVHALTFQLLARGIVSGLRIDHPDGLLDPLQYFRSLQSGYLRAVREAEGGAEPQAAEQLYVVAEKILSGDEPLCPEWPVSGTTGYEFLAQLGSLLVNPSGVSCLEEAYPRLAGIAAAARDVAYQSKLTILHDVMSSELHVLAWQFHRLAKEDRAWQDFTLPVLLRALREVIACFPVYRTYIRPEGWEVRDDDRRRVMHAVRWARRRNPTMPPSAFQFIAAVLLLDLPPRLGQAQMDAWRRVALKFQQVTGPVTAKGLEDTAFYRYYPLASLNEVGGELGGSGTDRAEFHRLMSRRREVWPHSLSTTATHDTKRGEDVRARLYVLSELADQWTERVLHWQALNQPRLVEVDEEPAPSSNELYLFYQTLIGTWPLLAPAQDAWETYVGRIVAYMRKALREAKVHTSWLNPSDAYEEAVEQVVRGLLGDRAGEFVRDVDAFARQISGSGFVNSLAQVVLKGVLPGVPDHYQGTEFWDFRLVDPDNRQPVDFDTRRHRLQSLEEAYAEDPAALVRRLSEGWEDRLKMFVLWRTLQIREHLPEVFAVGDYIPLPTEGPLEEHLVAIARRWKRRWAVATTVRLPWGLKRDVPSRAWGDRPSDFCGDLWGETRVMLPEEAPDEWTDGVGGRTIGADRRAIPAARLFDELPVSLLYCE